MEDGVRARAEKTRESIDVLIRAMRLHHRIVERRIEGLGVHHSQHRMLMRLSCLGTSATQKQLAETMDVSPACVARTLKPLLAAGLVDRASGSDSRCNEITLLPRGRQLVTESLAVFRQIDGEMFEGISEAELGALNGLLGRVYQNLMDMERRDARSAAPSDVKGADKAL